MIAMAGMNPMRYLMGTDSFERAVMVAIADRRNNLANEERQDLAGRIINTLNESMKGS